MDIINGKLMIYEEEDLLLEYKQAKVLIDFGEGEGFHNAKSNEKYFFRITIKSSVQKPH